MEIDRSTAVAICEALGFKVAGTYSKERLMNRIMTLESIVDESTVIGDSHLDNVLDDLLHALKKGESIMLVKDKPKEVVDEDDDPVAEEEEEVTDEVVEEDDSDEEEPINDTEDEEKPKSKGRKKVTAATTKARKGTATAKAKGAAAKQSTKVAKKKAAPKKRRIEATDDAPVKSKASKTKGKAADKTKTRSSSAGKDSFGARLGSAAATINAAILSSPFNKKKAFKAEEVSEAVDINLHRTGHHLNTLARKGLISKPGKNQYSVK